MAKGQRRALALVVALLGVVAVGRPVVFAGLDEPNADLAAPPDVKLLPVRSTAVVFADTYSVQRSFTGEITARRTADLAFERGGRVVEVSVDDGDVVAAGDVLARLDTRRLAAERRALAARLDQANAVLAELEEGPREEVIAAQRAQVASLAAQAAVARRNADRRHDLVERNAVSEEDADAADELANALAARRDAAQERLTELERGTRAEKLTAQRAVVAALAADLDAVDVELERGTLCAPWAGIVSSRMLDEGAVVPIGVPVVRVVEDAAPEARVGLPASLTSRARPGLEKALTVDGVTYQGVVRAVLPEIDPVTRTRTVVVVLKDATASDVAPGATVRVQVRDDVTDRGTWLPRAALVKAPRGLWACYALGDSDARDARRVERRLVEVIHTAGDRVLVRGALVDGDEVVTEGAHRVVPDQWVSTAPAVVATDSASRAGE